MTAPMTEVLFFDGYDDLDAVGPLEILTAAGFAVRAVAFPDHASLIRSAHGLAVSIDSSLGEAPQLLVVPGGGWFDDGPGAHALATSGDLPAGGPAAGLDLGVHRSILGGRG